jgi:hypothetical protein
MPRNVVYSLHSVASAGRASIHDCVFVLHEEPAQEKWNSCVIVPEPNPSPLRSNFSLGSNQAQNRVPEAFRGSAYCRWPLMAGARANGFGQMRGWGGLILLGIRGGFGGGTRDLFSGITRQAAYCRTPASLSLPLSSSSYFLLFTSTVNNTTFGLARILRAATNDGPEATARLRRLARSTS